MCTRGGVSECVQGIVCLQVVCEQEVCVMDCVEGVSVCVRECARECVQRYNVCVQGGCVRGVYKV